MSNRRTDLLDAAISLVGEGGIRALTHRAVDAAAGVPAGSAANYFRSRDALINAMVERFAEREKANWDDIATQLAPTSPAALAKALADAAKFATGPSRTLTLTRYAILVEAANQPALRAQLGGTGARVSAWATNWVRIAGSTDPERDAPVIMNHYTGIVLHELAIPAADFDPYPQLEALITALIPGGAT